MLKRSLLFVVLVILGFSFTQANASAARKQTGAKRAPSQGGVATPSSPDNWLGGTGNWSNGSDWSAGRPNNGSDVTIGTGNDYVTLDTSASINSLTLGGSSGSSTLIDPNNGAYILYIQGALTIQQSGTLSLSYDELEAHANSTNAGTINLATNTGFHVDANFVNSGTINLQNFCGIEITGTFNNTGNVIDIDDTNVLAANSGITNSGSIFLYQLQTGGNLTNATGGMINAQSLTVSGNMVNQGMLQGYSRGSQFFVFHELTNSGMVDLSYAEATVGSLNNSGGINLGGVMTVQGDAYNSGTISGYYLAILGQNITVDGTFTNAASGLLFLSTVGATLNGANNSGTIELESQGTLSANTLTNSGTIITGRSSGQNQIDIGKLTNNPSGTFSVLGAGDVATIHNVVNTGTITVGNGASLTVPPASHAAGNALAGFLNAGAVLISAGGTLSSPSRYQQNTGQTTVDGRLSGVINFAGGSVYGNGGTIAGSVTSNASLNFGDAPMTVGQLTFAGNFTQGANGGMTFDIASLSSYDKMNITGQARLNGMMTLDLLNGYVPQVGNLFEIMTFASESGTFSNVVGLPINGQEHFVLEYNSNNLTLDVVSGGLAGLSSLKTGSTNNEPYIQIAESTGLPMETGQGPLQTTPEPGSLLLLASGLAGTIGWIRRRAR